METTFPYISRTGSFTSAYDMGQATWEDELDKLKNMAELARKIEIVVNASHGLNYRNVIYVSQIHELWELNTSHSIMSRAVMVGLERAVRNMLALLAKLEFACFVA